MAETLTRNKLENLCLFFTVKTNTPYQYCETLVRLTNEKKKKKKLIFKLIKNWVADL